MALDVRSLTGDEIKTVLPDLARLRIVVFRDYPYLYDGTLEYEEEYLAKFAKAKGAVCVIARDGDQIVGASTAAPMIEHADEFGEPFKTGRLRPQQDLLLRRVGAAQKPSRPWARARVLRSSRGAGQEARRLHALDLLPRGAARQSSLEAQGLRAARRLLAKSAAMRPWRAWSPPTRGRMSTRTRRRSTRCSSG